MPDSAPTRLNPTALTVRISADEHWLDVEKWLYGQGFTLGWTPPLSGLSTLGELLQHRASGLRSSLYGELAAQCVGLEGILATGTPVRSRITPRSAAGPDWKHILLGGRGQTGRITQATLRIYRRPEQVEGYELLAPSLPPLGSLLGSAIQHGALPALVCLLPPPTGPLLRLTFEGEPRLLRARVALLERLAAPLGVSINRIPLADPAQEAPGEELDPTGFFPIDVRRYRPSPDNGVVEANLDWHFVSTLESLPAPFSSRWSLLQAHQTGVRLYFQASDTSAQSADSPPIPSDGADTRLSLETWLEAHGAHLPARSLETTPVGSLLLAAAAQEAR